MDRSTNVRELTHKPGEGKRFCESAAANSGAKDSLHGTNTTKTYSVGSSGTKGPYGGMNKGK